MRILSCCGKKENIMHLCTYCTIWEWKLQILWGRVCRREIWGDELALISTVAVIKRQRAVNSMFHYALTCIGMRDYTHAHTLTDRALYVQHLISLPRRESLAIPDAGWSAEPAWPETISDPRGGRTSQWAPRPWLKHQPLSARRRREERETGE